jgi:hypothetical protein
MNSVYRAMPQPAPEWLIKCTDGAFEVEYSEEAKSCLFSKVKFDRVKAHFAPLNARLAKRRGPSLPGFAVSPAAHSTTCVCRDAINASFWLRCTRWIFARQN